MTRRAGCWLIAAANAALWALIIGAGILILGR